MSGVDRRAGGIRRFPVPESVLSDSKSDGCSGEGDASEDEGDGSLGGGGAGGAAVDDCPSNDINFSG